MNKSFLSLPETHRVGCLLRELLAASQNGSRLCISLLDHLSLLVDKGESTNGGRAFEIGYVKSRKRCFP